MSNKSKFRVLNDIKLAEKVTVLVYGMTITAFLLLSIVILAFKEHLFLLWLTFIWRIAVISKHRTNNTRI